MNFLSSIVIPLFFDINPIIKSHKIKMIYLIGLGLHDEKDISLKGVEATRSCDKVYAELYTSPWQGSLDKLGTTLGKKITMLYRPDLEEGSKKILDEAEKSDVALLVSGDPLVATTHSSLIIDARKRGIDVKIIHASSVFSAVAESGLQIYKFGKTATVAYPEKNFFPKTPYDALAKNLEEGLHTLLLLDVKADESRYMSVAEAVSIMLQLEEKEGKGIFTNNTKIVGIARLGGDTKIKYALAKDFGKIDLGGPPHVMIVPGKLHFSEEEFLSTV
jgi:diphthine synthase